jgi:hypothetical protein
MVHVNPYPTAEAQAHFGQRFACGRDPERHGR